MSGKQPPFGFLLFLLFVIVGFVFNWWPGKEEVVRHYDAFVSFKWAPSKAYFEGHYDAVGGTVGSWIRQGEHAVRALLASSYGDAVRKGLIGYALFAGICLLTPSYRRGVSEVFHSEFFWEMFWVVVFFVGLTSLSFWALVTAERVHPGDPRTYILGDSFFDPLLTLFLFLIGLPGVVGVAIIGLSSVIWVPAMLLYLPGAVFLFVSFVLRVVLLVFTSPFKALLFLWHSLHYLFVPHPAETIYKAGMAKRLPIPELAVSVADAMYKYDLRDYERLPKAWKSKNWQRRIDAFHDRLKAEDRFMEELIRNLRLKDQLRE